MRAPGDSAVLLVALAMGACHSAPPVVPAGPGLVTFDRQPPEGATTFPRPEWTVGDRFVYRHGGEQRVAVRVAAIDEKEIALLDESAGVRNVVDRDFGYLRLESPEGEALTRWDPVDARCHWPLWVGKRWACQYVLREDGGAQVPVLVEYHCDAQENVEVPAGRYQALRIWRRSRPLLEGEWLDRTDVAWYAPELGQVVKRLEATVLTELEAVQRQ
ncbi:MAG: hypothetical protein IT457_22890 [Planctomycetes bacterium]|nr:hypothetical protein [Planctomycetota bacterium]